MKLLIAIDIGNTNITAGVFSASRLIGSTKAPTRLYSQYERRFRRFFGDLGVLRGCDADIVISSVVPDALTRLVACLGSFLKGRIRIIGKDVDVPISNLYRNRKEVGQDRLVNAYAASALYGAPCVIVDFGTAITFDAVSSKGEYLGGLILPGIEMSLRGLYEKTALLPRVELSEAPGIIGKDTSESMRAGILFGFGAMCDGLAGKYRRLLGAKTKMVATGGNAALVSKYSSSIRIVDEYLILKGILLVSVRG